MACDKNTCKVCGQIAKFRSFRKLLPASVRESFEKWYKEISDDAEMASMDLATSMLEWRQDQPRYNDETELRYKHRLLEWEEYKNGHKEVSNN